MRFLVGSALMRKRGLGPVSCMQSTNGMPTPARSRATSVRMGRTLCVRRIEAANVAVLFAAFAYCLEMCLRCQDFQTDWLPANMRGLIGNDQVEAGNLPIESAFMYSEAFRWEMNLLGLWHPRERRPGRSKHNISTAITSVSDVQASR